MLIFNATLTNRKHCSIWKHQHICDSMSLICNCFLVLLADHIPSKSSNRERTTVRPCVCQTELMRLVWKRTCMHTLKYLVALILQSPAVIDIRLLKSRETPQRILNNLWHFLTVCSPLLPLPPQASQQNKYFQWINKSKWHWCPGVAFVHLQRCF